MISNELKNIILSELNLSEFNLSDTTVASEVPGWDSISHINIILAIEIGFNVKFKGMEMMKIQNLGELQKLINSKLN